MIVSLPQLAWLIVLVVAFALETHLLSVVIDELIWLRNVLDIQDSSDGPKTLWSTTLRKGDSAPDFRAPTLDPIEAFSTQSLIGAQRVVMFVRPADMMHFGVDVVAAAIAGMWSKAEDRIFVVVQDQPEAVQAFAAAVKKQGVFSPYLVYVPDPSGKLSKQFKIQKTPSAILFDEGATVVRTGQIGNRDDDIGQAGDTQSHVGSVQHGIG